MYRTVVITIDRLVTFITGVPDVDRKILSFLDNDDLFAIKDANRYLHQILDDSFWRPRFLQSFGAFPEADSLSGHTMRDWHRRYLFCGGRPVPSSWKLLEGCRNTYEESGTLKVVVLRSTLSRLALMSNHFNMYLKINKKNDTHISTRKQIRLMLKWNAFRFYRAVVMEDRDPLQLKGDWSIICAKASKEQLTEILSVKIEGLNVCHLQIMVKRDDPELLMLIANITGLYRPERLLYLAIAHHSYKVATFLIEKHKGLDYVDTTLIRKVIKRGDFESFKWRVDQFTGERRQTFLKTLETLFGDICGRDRLEIVRYLLDSFPDPHRLLSTRFRFAYAEKGQNGVDSLYPSDIARLKKRGDIVSLLWNYAKTT